MGVTEQLTLFSDNAEYDAFTKKFIPKKTTDDCYTPPNVHKAVMEWVEREYDLDQACFIRPFWPGADYKAAAYPPKCVVVDNPPFSILKQIVDFYIHTGTRFFLYAPALTLLTRRNHVCHIAVGVHVNFENGAVLPISFVTNLEECVLRTAPALYRQIKAANDYNLALVKKSVPKYQYPPEVITAAMAQRWSKYGAEYSVGPDECTWIRALDEQEAKGKEIFGGGLLLSEAAAEAAAKAAAAAAAKAAAEAAAAAAKKEWTWKLSEREKALVRAMGGGRE